MLNHTMYSGIVKSNLSKSMYLKKKIIYLEVASAPHGWVEVINKIKIKMEKDYN